MSGFRTRRALRAWLVCWLMLGVAPLHAQTHVSVPAGKDGRLDCLVRVSAPTARSATVSDRHGWLAVVHVPKSGTSALSLFRLDPSTGSPAAKPVSISLPKCEGFTPTALSAAFHPKLPLLYVWQDVDYARDGKNGPQLPANSEEKLATFDHLLIYSLEADTPRLLTGLCRGAKFGWGLPEGGLAVSTSGNRLYIPNLRVRNQQWQSIIGQLTLDAHGLPTFENEPAIEEKEARIKSIDKAVAANKPLVLAKPPTDSVAFPTRRIGSGFGYALVDDNAALTGGHHSTALVAWMVEDRRASLFTAHIHTVGPTTNWIAGHPHLPVVYSVGMGHSVVHRFEHADGYVTLAPQHASLEGGLDIISAPVVLAKSNRLALGSHGRLHVLSLDDRGKIKTDHLTVPLGKKAEVRGIAYAEKWDKLYVAVEKSE